jgi:hypothetical protein
MLFVLYCSICLSKDAEEKKEKEKKKKEKKRLIRFLQLQSRIRTLHTPTLKHFCKIGAFGREDELVQIE